VLPGEFLQVAEETGLVVPIGRLVLERVVRQARSWADAGVPVGRIAINVADAQFGSGDLDLTVAETLAAARLPAGHLEIEVTEGVFLGRNAGLVEESLHRLHSRGVSIALDDFGTGHASLTHLRRFPIDKLKIDRSFVRDMLDDPNDAVIVRTIIDLGHDLGLEIVAGDPFPARLPAAARLRPHPGSSRRHPGPRHAGAGAGIRARLARTGAGRAPQRRHMTGLPSSSEVRGGGPTAVKTRSVKYNHNAVRTHIG
jgi:hypothetical protein